MKKILMTFAVFLGIMFASMFFASGGITINHGKNTTVLFMDVVLPQNIITFLESNPLVKNVWTYETLGKTEIEIENTGTPQYYQLLSRNRQIYNYILNAQTGLLSNQLGNLNCRSVANVNVNVSSRIVYNQTTQTFDEKWFVNPNCNGIGNGN